jgi:hypothetical protein
MSKISDEERETQIREYRERRIAESEVIRSNRFVAQVVLATEVRVGDWIRDTYPKDCWYQVGDIGFGNYADGKPDGKIYFQPVGATVGVVGRCYRSASRLTVRRKRGAE